MRKIAITGGLSSGKTSVCRILESCGAYVVSADEIVHQLLSSDTPLGQRIIKEFGSYIISNNQLDREKIAQLVFSNPAKLQLLETLIHPAVFNEIEKRYRRVAKEQKYTLFVAEIPLLYESKNEKFYDAVIAVVADPDLCIQRFNEKTGYSPEEYEKRMKRQIPPEQKATHADYVVVNNGNLQELKEKVLQLIPHLKGEFA